jgi:hypothetical protein
MRKSRIIFLPALLACSLLIAPIAARATTNFGLQFDTNGHQLNFCDNNVAFTGCTPLGLDGDPTLGVIAFSGSVGNWTIDKGNGFGPPFEVLPLLLDLSSFNAETTNGHGANALTILLSVTNLTGPLGVFNFVNAAGGTSSLGTTVYTSQAFLSTSNTVFCGSGCGTPITNQLLLSGLNFSGSQSGTGATGAGPYAVTLQITIDANGPDQTSFDSQLTQNSIPEPATLSVLGAGLLALGTGLRRKLAGA